MSVGGIDRCGIGKGIGRVGLEEELIEGRLFNPGIAGISAFGSGSFFTLLFSLLQHRVRVLTEGDVNFVEGLLTDITPTFITVVGAQINFIPIRQITIIARTFV